MSDTPPILAVDGSHRLAVGSRDPPRRRASASTAGEFTGLDRLERRRQDDVVPGDPGTAGSPSAGPVLIDGRIRSHRNPLIGYVPQKISSIPTCRCGLGTSSASASTDTASGSRCRRPRVASIGRRDARAVDADRFRRRPSRQPFGRRTTAGPHRPRADQPSPTAAARRAARQPRHPAASRRSSISWRESRRSSRSRCSSRRTT